MQHIDNENKAQKRTVLREIFSYVRISLCTILTLTVVFSLNFVPSESMEPTIKKGSIMVNWRLPYLLGDPSPDYGDVIVFREASGNKRLLVKRVIGLPGDVISFSEGKVCRNGTELEEPYLKEENSTRSVTPEFTVPENAVFVLGDNREVSNDSRFMEGTYVEISSIYARELFAVFPFFVLDGN